MAKLKQSLELKLLQKLSPQQIQFIKLLQLNTLDLEQKIQEELLENPAIELTGEEDVEEEKVIGEDEVAGIEDELRHEGDQEVKPKEDDEYGQEEVEEDITSEPDELFDIGDYTSDDGDDESFHLYEESDPNEERKEMPVATSGSFQDYLIEQFEAIAKTDKEDLIGLQIIGSLDEDGYLRREIPAIVNDLAFTQNVDADEKEVEHVLYKIQALEPAGIAARDLQECLLLQLHRKEQNIPGLKLAILIIEKHMEDFIRKHYDKLCARLKISEADLKEAIQVIVKLNPKPGDAGPMGKSQYIIPDFILNQGAGRPEVILNARNVPDLRISRSYMETLRGYEKNPSQNKQIKETVQFIKQKLDSAKWFIDSIKQRHQTLLLTMNAIVDFQKDFFQTGEETSLKPMILKDIADAVHLDISTISRVANSKYVETEFGIFPLKYFFSEGVANEDGEEVSNREIKKILSDCIAGEDKSKPLPDEKLMEILKEKGYPIARRTVAKYREQLNIPVARLRREI